MIKTGTLPQLSVQELIDCARRKKMLLNGYKYVEGEGCKGNTVLEAYRYMAYTGLVNSVDYPQRRQLFGFGVLGAHGTCYRGKLNYKILLPSAITHFEFVAPNEKQPVVIYVDEMPAIAATYYKGGVLGLEDWPPSDDPSKQSTHAVLVVGYRTWFGTPCWDVRNSWGLRGDGGFMKLERKVKNPLGVGGMYRLPGTYPHAVAYPSFVK